MATMQNKPWGCFSGTSTTLIGELLQGQSCNFNHSLLRAIQDLANFTPFPDEWSVEDKVLFEQAFQVEIRFLENELKLFTFFLLPQFHGKSFHRIRQMLPDKSIAALVKYYYRYEGGKM